MAEHSGCNRKGLEAQFIDLRHQFYYHYLAYANSAVAILLAVIAWRFIGDVDHSHRVTIAVFAVAAIAIIILTLAARSAIQRYDEQTKNLIGLATS